MKFAYSFAVVAVLSIGFNQNIIYPHAARSRSSSRASASSTTPSPIFTGKEIRSKAPGSEFGILLRLQQKMKTKKSQQSAKGRDNLNERLEDINRLTEQLNGSSEEDLVKTRQEFERLRAESVQRDPFQEMEKLRFREIDEGYELLPFEEAYESQPNSSERRASKQAYEEMQDAFVLRARIEDALDKADQFLSMLEVGGESSDKHGRIRPQEADTLWLRRSPSSHWRDIETKLNLGSSVGRGTRLGPDIQSVEAAYEVKLKNPANEVPNKLKGGLSPEAWLKELPGELPAEGKINVSELTRIIESSPLLIKDTAGKIKRFNELTADELATLVYIVSDQGRTGSFVQNLALVKRLYEAQVAYLDEVSSSPTSSTSGAISANKSPSKAASSSASTQGNGGSYAEQQKREERNVVLVGLGLALAMGVLGFVLIWISGKMHEDGGDSEDSSGDSSPRPFVGGF